jgi:cytochrome c-type biogenesis protein CcmH/NrfG
MTVKPMARADVLFRLGDLLANLGDEYRAAAEEHFRAALAVQPEHGSALGGLGFLAEGAGDPAAARSYYEKAAKLAPDDVAAQFRYASNLLDDPGPDSLRLARAALARAVAVEPDLGEAWARLGYTYQSEATLSPAAVSALETAHRLLPSRMDVAHNLALAYARTGETGKAEELIARELVPRAKPEEIEDAREAVLDEEQRQAEELIDQQRFGEALPHLEAVKAKTTRSGRRADLETRIEEIRHAVNFNAFIERYNQAVELANQGNVKGALAILEPLLTTAQDPVQVERARNLIEHLRPAKKGRADRQ